MFENMHKNQTWALIDGLLTGTMLTALAAYLYSQFRENKEATDAYRTGWTHGAADALTSVLDAPPNNNPE